MLPFRTHTTEEPVIDKRDFDITIEILKMNYSNTFQSRVDMYIFFYKSRELTQSLVPVENN